MKTLEPPTGFEHGTLDWESSILSFRPLLHFRKNRQFVTAQNYATLYLMIHSNNISKCCSRVEHNTRTKIIVNFTEDSTIEANWQFGSKLAYIYTTLYLMIYPNNFFTCCRLMGHKRFFMFTKK